LNGSPVWKEQRAGVEEMKVAVRGCVVNGPGESKHANLGISAAHRHKPVTTLRSDKIVEEFIGILDDYVDSHYAVKAELELKA